MRETGFYWVIDRKDPGIWTIAKWNPHQWWWVLGWPPFYDREHGVCGDGRFERIGARIEQPEL